MSGPGVEDLHRLCPIVCLVADVDGDGLSQLGKEGVEDLGVDGGEYTMSDHCAFSKQRIRDR